MGDKIVYWYEKKNGRWIFRLMPWKGEPMIIKAEELKIVYEKEDDGRVRPVYFIDAIPISFIKTHITELKRERNKYEIGTLPFRYHDVKIYYYEMLMEEWKGRTDE